ncbi:hypothetical protein RJ55_06907 [Drechmeria coniospora]|nr:hypothetical protein RJ55_06907 [Drechmeria coniospora]
MAVMPPAEIDTVGRHRGVQNRQCALYASRIKPTVTPLVLDSSDAARSPVLPVSPRWDSLSHGPFLKNRSPTSTGRASPFDARPEPQGQQGLPAQTQTQVQAPTWAGTEAVPRESLSGHSTPERRSPSVPLSAKSSMAEMRSLDGVAMENFSRPRKQSIRQPLLTSSPEPIVPETVNAHRLPPRPTDLLEFAPQTPPPWQRRRRPSASSSQSASAFPSPLAPPTGEAAEPRSRRTRNATGPPIVAGGAPSPTVANLMDSAAPVPGGAPAPWLNGDELRSSFRSQLTASTTPGTAVTERCSSLLTKNSSVTSLYAANPDEPSLEDVMGMYEKGFADDDDEDDDDDDNRNYNSNNHDGINHDGTVGGKRNDDDDDEENDDDDKDYRGGEAHHDDTRRTIDADDDDGDTHFDSPSATAMSERPGLEGKALSDDFGPALPTARSTLDAEIRQSRMIFTSAAFTSTVHAISGSADSKQPNAADNRDSAKSFYSQPSVVSVSVPGLVHAGTGVDGMPTAPSPASASPSPCPSPLDTPLRPPVPIDLEDPGSRDRYGFKKQSPHVSREKYDLWDKGYSQYLARRRKKWVTYMKDCALMTDRPIRFPAPNAKTKRFVRKGIPPDWRGAAWFYYAGGPAILAKHSGLYDKLVLKQAKQVDVEAIERDLHRTFPDNIQFKPSARYGGPSVDRGSQFTAAGSTSSDDDGSFGPPGEADEPVIISSLRRVLHAFAVYNPRIGYCQSLNFLAGLLLLFVETEEQCFWLLNVITIIYLPGTHDMSLEGSRVDLGVLMTELRDTMPAVWDKIGGELEGNPDSSRPGTSKSIRKPLPKMRRRDLPRLSTERLPPITMCMTAWFMSCFIGTLPIETTLRVWDVFFYEGSKTLFRIALAIFKTGEAEIKAVSDPMEMFGVVQSMPRRMVDANQLMAACFKRRNGFGHLSQVTIDERRQARRERAHQDKAEKLSGDGRTEGTSEVETEPVQRRGTLFSKRRGLSRSRTVNA